MSATPSTGTEIRDKENESRQARGKRVRQAAGGEATGAGCLARAR